MMRSGRDGRELLSEVILANSQKARVRGLCFMYVMPVYEPDVEQGGDAEPLRLSSFC